MSEATETTIEIPGYRLGAKVWGPPDGAPVLALHGWLDNAATYDGLAPHLKGLRIVALDMPGHGMSDHAPPGHLYPFIDFVAAAYGVLAALGWERCSLMGHSLGAGVCAVLAGTVPERIERLVLLEGLGPLSSADDMTPKRLSDALAEQVRKGEKPSPVYADRAKVEQMLAAAPSKLAPHSVRTLLARGLEAVDGGVRWRSDRRLRFTSRVRLTEAQVLAFLGRIACPTLLLKGKDGFTYAGSQGSERAAAVDDLRVVEVPGRHHVHLDAPQVVAPHVASFLGVST